MTSARTTWQAAKAIFAAVTGGLLLAASGLVNAETVQVPVGQQAKAKSGIERPISGMAQSQVEARFGKPLDWQEAVGEPPISSWVYQDFVVYFEYDRVIHTVLTPEPATSADLNRQN